MRILFFSVFFNAKGHETYLADEVLTIARNYKDIEYIIYTVIIRYDNTAFPKSFMVKKKLLSNYGGKNKN
ncbi:MAG: hypothetical protein ACP6IY_22600 [Promethearchaeia archaeon]